MKKNIVGTNIWIHDYKKIVYPDDRRSGRTTRIVDESIQRLFEFGEVNILDHHMSRDMNIRMAEIICTRLEQEHKVLPMPRKNEDIQIGRLYWQFSRNKYPLVVKLKYFSKEKKKEHE